MVETNNADSVHTSAYEKRQKGELGEEKHHSYTCTQNYKKKRPLQKKYANKSCDISVFGQVSDKILKLAQVVCTCYMAYITLDQFVTS